MDGSFRCMADFQWYLMDAGVRNSTSDAISVQLSSLRVWPSDGLSSFSSSSSSSNRLSLSSSDSLDSSSWLSESSSSSWPCLLAASLVFRKTTHSSSLLHSSLFSGSRCLFHLSWHCFSSRPGSSSVTFSQSCSLFSAMYSRSLTSSDAFHFFGLAGLPDYAFLTRDFVTSMMLSYT